MSSHLNILLDTNIIISLNDLEYPLDPRLAEMQRLLDQLSFHVFVHPAQKDDLNRDTNADRRRRNLSRLDQYNVLNSPPEPSPEDISALGWVENRDNDRVDNLLLYALKSGAVHILVSEDRGVSRKAYRAGLQDQVHHLDQFIFFLRNQVEPAFEVPYGIELKHIYRLHIESSFWDSLRESYPGFDSWFHEAARQHRQAWCICNEKDEPLAVCIFKEENNPEVTIEPHQTLYGKVLKLCTFKVAEELRGRKLGERLLYTAFKYASENGYDHAYIQVHAQDKLIELCSDFGFYKIGKYNEDEVYVKDMKNPDTGLERAHNPFEFAKLYYPNFLDGNDVNKFIIPIQPQYHNELFPDISDDAEGLFANQLLSQQSQSNTIKKAYLCQSNTNQISSGDILLFYRSEDRKSIQVIGIVEHVKRFSIDDIAMVQALVSKRTVFSEEQLKEQLKKPTLLILFRFIKYIPKIYWEGLKNAGISGTIQSIRKISNESYCRITGKL